MAAQPPPSLVVPASLYVGDLHPEINDEQLSNAFSEYNPSSVRVCRDSSTGRSLCYGYVNLLSPQDATCAIEAKNHTMLYGKMIRVTRANRDPDVRRSGIGNVFVKNLNESVNNVQLQELFQNFGNILSCKVSTFEDGKSKGYGFVQFESEESSNAAIENLNGTSIGGKHIYVGKFMKKSERSLQSPKYTNLYIKNLDVDITEDLLKEKFSVFGNIMSLIIVRDNNGVSRGFGFVNFEKSDDAKKAVEAMNGLNLGGKVLFVGRAQKKSEREQILRHQFEEWRKEQISKCQGSNVYVKNIDDNVTESQLQEHFSQCGRITSVKLMVNEKGISKGFGFVCFSTPEEARKALMTFYGCMFHGKPLYVAIAQRKEERQAKLQIEHAQRMAGIAGPSTIIHTGYSPIYYTTPPGVITQVPPRPMMMYQHMGIRPGWRPNNTFAPPTRPAAETSSFSSIQKQMLGERLYPLVNQQEPDLAAKITGMLLEMDNLELVLLLESPAALSAKIKEAVHVLKLSSNRTNVSTQDGLHANLLSAQVAVN